MKVIVLEDWLGKAPGLELFPGTFSAGQKVLKQDST